MVHTIVGSLVLLLYNNSILLFFCILKKLQFYSFVETSILTILPSRKISVGKWVNFYYDIE